MIITHAKVFALHPLQNPEVIAAAKQLGIKLTHARARDRTLRGMGLGWRTYGKSMKAKTSGRQWQSSQSISRRRNTLQQR